ncbi:MAG: type II toxin-antitoxin system VapC family toxin [Gemmatimonadales bacterium]|nr:type II toxin-antitoxin system VapC family toxin [Gemmatimonadales bacterium]MYG20300.1 type II toxin-antitoxin system VapC family toxin [Gemmatimonadales bacterium]MYH11211.1 type II toxin-antitoxin system VapC family toxin [Gemmatimonadales bacterium]MYL07853.1 type II toxin-antitoxin system VapC family toxin [Gemmatimonadales bacterium]
MIVVDTNVMMSFVFGGTDGAAAADLLRKDPEWAAPVILLSELRNALLGVVRRGVATSAQVKAMGDDAAHVLGSRIVGIPGGLVIDIALECGLTAYDAEFVAVARALGVRLATLDRQVLRVAPDVAVSLRDLGRPGAERSAT